jgi:hypothetical protein
VAGGAENSAHSSMLALGRQEYDEACDFAGLDFAAARRAAGRLPRRVPLRTGHAAWRRLCVWHALYCRRRQYAYAGDAHLLHCRFRAWRLASAVVVGAGQSSSLLKKVFEVSRWATLIQDPSARRTKDSQPSGFGFEYCASHVRFRVFQQTARSDLVDFRLGLGRRFAGQPRRFCSHRSIDDRHRAAQAWHAVVRCHHAAPRLALFGLGTL